jgi:hypothetical protein
MNNTLELSLPGSDPAEAPDSASGRERVLILGFLYLQAGLSPEAAYRSALADYQCGLTA